MIWHPRAASQQPPPWRKYYLRTKENSMATSQRSSSALWLPLHQCLQQACLYSKLPACSSVSHTCGLLFPNLPLEILGHCPPHFIIPDLNWGAGSRSCCVHMGLSPMTLSPSLYRTRFELSRGSCHVHTRLMRCHLSHQASLAAFP